MNRYEEKSSYPKINAQQNLIGRTHYVDDDTLCFHKSRILQTHVVDQGLLFCLIESCALDMNNTARGFRYVIFDIFGKVISRVDLENSFKSKKACVKAMWKALNEIDANQVTKEGIERFEKNCIEEIKQMRKLVA